MNTPPEDPFVIYFEQKSHLVKQGPSQVRNRYIRGLYRPDIQDGIEQLSTADNDTFQRLSFRAEEKIRLALEGRKKMKRGNVEAEYQTIGKIPLNANAPEEVQGFTAAKISALMEGVKGTKGGEEESKGAIREIISIFTAAAKAVARSTEAPSAQL